jgi:uncharacterized protein (TIGR02284 family)
MQSNESLKALHTDLIDARKGYETAYRDAETSDMKAFFQDMLDMHERAHGEIHRILSSRGETPEDDGSFMATVHKTVITLRSAISGLGGDSLSSFADGEERILKSYDEALADAASDSSASAILKRQRGDLAARVAEMKRKAA